MKTLIQKSTQPILRNVFSGTRLITFSTILLLLLFFTNDIFAQQKSVYNRCAGKNKVYKDVVSESESDLGSVSESSKKVLVESDSYGNALGNQYDLAIDGAFEGETVAVLQLYAHFSFDLPKAALKEKGFSVYRWINSPPTAVELKESLKKACQLWIISDSQRKLTPEHLAVIKEFFDSGKGVYIWGDNQPFYADANYVSEALIGVKMLGDLPGGKNVGLNKSGKNVGLEVNHLITTGLQNVYEGITIATIQPNQTLTPLIYGHESNLVAATYEKNGKRLILDGGFTRLYCGWESAGTGRYVKNAAAWLVNYERFGKTATK